MKLVLLQPQLRAFDNEHSTAVLRSLIDSAKGSFDERDVIVLPEHFYFGSEAEPYHDFIRELAVANVCHVIGGSFHEQRDGKPINTGYVVNPYGEIIASYDKLRPYAEEQKWVEPGETLGEFQIDGVRFLCLICADFWFSDLIYRAKELPDILVVPALSVTRKSTQDYSRELWRHLAISRAYEFGVYVGISDWGYPSELPSLFTCGVGGFANPTTVIPSDFFHPIGNEGVLTVAIDLDALNEFRDDRRQRGFFWK